MERASDSSCSRRVMRVSWRLMSFSTLVLEFASSKNDMGSRLYKLHTRRSESTLIGDFSSEIHFMNVSLVTGTSTRMSFCMMDAGLFRS